MLASTMPPVVLVAPAAFKGTLGPRQVAEAIAAGVRRALPGGTLLLCLVQHGRGAGALLAIRKCQKEAAPRRRWILRGTRFFRIRVATRSPRRCIGGRCTPAARSRWCRSGVWAAKGRSS